MRNRYFLIGIVLILFLAFPEKGIAQNRVRGSRILNSDLKRSREDKPKIEQKGTGWGTSLAPVLGMDDRAGGRIGAAAYFYKESPAPGIPGFVTGLMVSGKIGVRVDLRLVDFKKWDIRTRSIFSRDTETYYGEGPRTSALNPIRVDGNRFEFDGAAMRRINHDFRIGMDLTMRARKQRGAEREGIIDLPINTNVIPNEVESGGGLRAEWDNRDKRLYPTKGRIYTVRLLVFPPEWSNRETPKENYSAQIQIDCRHYQKVLDRVVWANRAMLATSQGDLGYQYRYSLGGTRRLRGYGSNRFRGDHLYLYQSELRWRVWDKYLFMVGSAGLGGVVDKGKTQLHGAQQLGVRIALPPSWGWKLRLEQAWGSDQKNFIIQIGETF